MSPPLIRRMARVVESAKAGLKMDRLHFLEIVEDLKRRPLLLLMTGNWGFTSRSRRTCDFGQRHSEAQLRSYRAS